VAAGPSLGFGRNFMILSCGYLRLWKELMSWITLAVVLVAWSLIGLAVAYLFGRFTHRGEAYGNAGQLAPPVVSYLRRAKRAKALSRAIAHSKPRREAASGRSVH
jgi:hypothetical protein